MGWHCISTNIWKSLELKAVQIESTKNGNILAIFDGYSSSDILCSFAFLFIHLDRVYKKVLWIKYFNILHLYSTFHPKGLNKLFIQLYKSYTELAFSSPEMVESHLWQTSAPLKEVRNAGHVHQGRFSWYRHILKS